MAAAAQFRIQHLAEAPRGWKVRSKRTGEHVLRIAFPPGRRRRGSGKLLEILHPKKNAACEEGSCKPSTNPSELLIFGNPNGKVPKAPKGHKPDCQCPFCKRARNETTRKKQSTRAGRARRNARPHRRPGATEFVCKRCGKGFTAAQVEAGEYRKHLAEHRRRRAANPSETEQAVRLFETFHGKDASSIVEKHVSAALRKDYTALGDLIYVKVLTPVGQVVKFEFEGDGVKLASSPNGKQLYCIGGRQNLLPLLDEASQQKDFIDLGECQEVAYLARKIHSNYEPVEWFHKFGERAGSAKPQLMFDKLKKQIFFVGGEYSIDPNVDVSPGIEN